MLSRLSMVIWYPTVVALPQFCGSQSSSSFNSSISPGNVTIGESKPSVYQILPALDYIRHTCVSCYDANFQEYCPSDGKCHPSGDCSSCGNGMTAIDETHHHCMKPSPETCKKDRNMFFCPSDNECHPQSDCSRCVGFPVANHSQFICAACTSYFCGTSNTCVSSCSSCYKLPESDNEKVCKDCSTGKALCLPTNECLLDCSQCNGFPVKTGNVCMESSASNEQCILDDDCGRRPTRLASCDTEVPVPYPSVEEHCDSSIKLVMDSLPPAPLPSSE